MFNPEKQEGIHENHSSNPCESHLISEGVAFDPTVYSDLESGTKLIFSFVPDSFFYFYL